MAKSSGAKSWMSKTTRAPRILGTSAAAIRKSGGLCTWTTVYRRRFIRTATFAVAIAVNPRYSRATANAPLPHSCESGSRWTSTPSTSSRVGSPALRMATTSTSQPASSAARASFETRPSPTGYGPCKTMQSLRVGFKRRPSQRTLSYSAIGPLGNLPAGEQLGPLPQHRIAAAREGASDRVRKLDGVARDDLATREPTQELGKVADWHRDHRRHAGERLLDRDGRAFEVRGDERHVDGVHDVGHLLAREALQAHGCELDPLARLIDGCIEQIDTLVRIRAGSRQEHVATTLGPAQRRAGLRGRLRSEKIEVDAGRNDRRIRAAEPQRAVSADEDGCSVPGDEPRKPGLPTDPWIARVAAVKRDDDRDTAVV